MPGAKAESNAAVQEARRSDSKVGISRVEQEQRPRIMLEYCRGSVAVSVYTNVAINKNQHNTKTE